VRPRIIRPAGGLSRRAFFGGAGSAIGLPFLESLAPRSAKAAAPAPVRLVYWFVPNGLDMATFRPADTGEGYTTPPMLVPLEALKPHFSVVTGLENIAARPDELGDHASGTGAFLTCIHVNKSETDIRNGISVDQIAANQVGSLTRLPSLQLGIDGGGGSGNCDSGYSCAYARNISWANETTPLPKTTDPGQVFDTIFQGFDPTESSGEAEKRRLYATSVLDVALEQFGALSPKLGYTDRVKLQQYEEGIRELELRLSSSSSLSCEQGERPTIQGGRNTDYQEHLRVMTDLTVLALTCDATRIVTFMLGNALSGRAHPFLGIEGGHHDISHHAGDANLIAELAQIGIWEMEQFAYLLNRMNEVPDGTDGSTLLTNSVVFLSSDISDGNRHNHDDLPVLLAGHGAGALAPGKHVAYPTGFRDPKQKMSNLFVTMLSAAGVSATVGDSDGVLPDLLAQA
jgi:hypothetical protein